MSAAHPLPDLSAIQAYTLAGRAVVTLVSRVTGARRTFRLRQVGEAPPPVGEGAALPWSGRAFFVDLLAAADNEGGYRYLAFARFARGGVTLKVNQAQWGREAYAALGWFLRQLVTGGAGLGQVEVWHSGRCGRCGRRLTVPASVAAGLGPGCAGRAA